MAEIALSVKNIHKTFHDGHPLTALDNISLDVQSGEIFMLLGPSGCGKSTLLRILSGLEKPTGGSFSYGNGLKYTDISFVFQQFALLPWLNVAENIRLGLVSRPLPESERNMHVNREIKRMGLEKFTKAYPRELSGGQRQRVGIARALATDPKIIFMDEPFSELDSFIAKELQSEILSIWQERKPTIVMVSHNIQEALTLGHRIAVLSPHPGKLRKIIDNPLPHPRNARSQDFFRLEDEIYKLIEGY